MRRFALLVAAAAAFGLWPFAGRLGIVTGSIALLALGVLLALAASATVDGLAAAGGALGALSAALVGPASPAAAGAALVALAYAERTTRVKGGTTKLVHVGGALVAGALAGTITTAYGSGSVSIRVVAALVAAVLAALPLFVEADDPVAYALDGLAEDCGEEAGAARAVQHAQDPPVRPQEAHERVREETRSTRVLVAPVHDLDRRPAGPVAHPVRHQRGAIAGQLAHRPLRRRRDEAPPQ